MAFIGYCVWHFLILGIICPCFARWWLFATAIHNVLFCYYGPMCYWVVTICYGYPQCPILLLWAHVLLGGDYLLQLSTMSYFVIMGPCVTGWWLFAMAICNVLFWYNRLMCYWVVTICYSYPQCPILSLWAHVLLDDNYLLQLSIMSYFLAESVASLANMLDTEVYMSWFAILSSLLM